MLFQYGKQQNGLFFSDTKPENTPIADNRTLWLRRRITNRRILEVRSFWPKRILALELSGESKDYLVLDCSAGPDLREELDPLFEQEVQWPAEDADFTHESVWRAFPQISPALRRQLKGTPPEQRENMTQALKKGRCGPFYVYLDQHNGQENDNCECYVWPLSHEHAAGRELKVVATATEAARMAGRPGFFASVSKARAAEEVKIRKQREKQLKRALSALGKEAGRLEQLVKRREHGVAIQSVLYTLDPAEKCSFVTGVDLNGDDLEIALDPKLSILENMQRCFKLAAKGERGREQIERRRRELQEELRRIQSGLLDADTKNAAIAKQKAEQKKQRPGKKAKSSKDELKNVQRFRSSDGFLLLRGKNSAANHKLLSQAARPFDIWFHAQDGPGAHVILKRDSPDQAPPRDTMLEAAVLAGLKSWQSKSDRAKVICALVKDVRKAKGMALGQVRVTEILESLFVELDPSLEEDLKIESKTD